MKFPKPKKIYDYQELARWVESNGHTREQLRKLLVGSDGAGQNTVHMICRENVEEGGDPKNKELAELIFAQVKSDEIEVEVWW